MEELGPNDGPDQVLPSTEFSTINVSSPVKLRTGDTEIAKTPPLSVPGLLAEAAKKWAMRHALAYKKFPEEKGFHFVTFKEYHEQIRTVAKAFLKLGLHRFHSVAIIGFNSPEWFLANMGAIFAGGVGTGIYTTNSAEATFYCLEQGRVDIAVVEDDNQLKKVLKYKDKLPGLKAVIQYNGKPAVDGVLSWDEVLAIGKAESDVALDEALKRIAVNQCCEIIFTSGTTGNPKGVMLSHDNLIWDVKALAGALNFPGTEERIISYLPLSHVAAQLMDIYAQLELGVTVYFANKDALKGGLIKTLLEVRPTRFLGVPRVWEKIAEKIKSVGADAGYVKKTIASWAKAQGLHRHLELMKGVDSPSVSYLLARAVIFSKVRYNLGLDKCVSFWSGAAPLATDVKHYFASLDIPILEGFGMSECSGAHTINISSAFNFDSVGRTIPGAQTKIESPDKDKQGEICLYGRHVFMGYINDRDKTDEAIDNDGWLHSGDVGKLDENGFMYITGRIKELLITAGGENVAPILIEQNVKTELPFLGQAVVICDRRKFLSMLMTLSCEVNSETGEPKDELTDITKKWLQELGCPFNAVSEVLASGPDPKILSAIQQGLDAANEKAISNAQKVQKFAILPTDFSIPTGELGPTMKLKRSVVNEKYKDIIDRLYAD